LHAGAAARRIVRRDVPAVRFARTSFGFVPGIGHAGAKSGP